MAEYFDSKGRILTIDLNANGSLFLYNDEVKAKIPENKVFYVEGEEIKTISSHMITYAKYDNTNTRIIKVCKKCKHDIQVIIGQNDSFFYICEGCENVKEKITA